MRHFRTALAAAVFVWAGAWPALQTRAPELPARLPDAEFRQLIHDASEADGSFPSDNLVSNEDTFQFVIPELQKTVKPGGVYVGVGPDQNFTYISALKPAVVFIPDIRRGNLNMHLMYKALMEQSADRADFLSRLFSRKRPDGLSAASTPEQLFEAYAQVEPSRALFDQGMEGLISTLSKRGLKPDQTDLRGIEYILTAFFSAGPNLTYASSGAGRQRYPTFAELQTTHDGAGVARGYLATEENYRTVRALHQNNLIIPLVGNFAGEKTLRSIGSWVRARGGTVTTFYASNVEQYLFQDGVWGVFAGNLAELPLDETSTFIRSCFQMCVKANNNGSRVVMLLDSISTLVRDHKAGQINAYFQVLSRSR